MGVGVLLAGVVDIVGGHQREAKLPRQRHLACHDPPLLGVVVVHDLQVHVLVPEDVHEGLGVLASPGDVILNDAPADVSLLTAAERDQAIPIRGEQLSVHTGLVVEAVEVRSGDELHQIAVAVEVLCKQDEMTQLPIALGVLIEARARGAVDLAADDGPYARTLARLIELDSAVHHAVVGDGKRRHLEFLGAGDELADPAGAVQETVLGVHVQVDVVGGHGVTATNQVIGADDWARRGANGTGRLRRRHGGTPATGSGGPAPKPV